MVASFGDFQHPWLNRYCVRLKFTRSQISASSSFCSALSSWKFEAYFYFFVFHLIELLFGRVLVSVCEAQLRLCVIFVI